MSEQIKDGGPAGVLEVMERASKWMFCKRTGVDREMGLWAARKAVAELMGAALEIEQTCRQHDGAEVESFRRLAAAIRDCEAKS